MRLYRLLTGPDDASFCHKVSKALDDSWELHGDPCYAYNAQNGSMQCAQAVVKTVTGKKYNPEMKLGDY